MSEANQERFVPFTPGGSCCMDLAASTEEQAWKNLLQAASHMPYKTKQKFIERGYEVVDMDDAQHIGE